MLTVLLVLSPPGGLQLGNFRGLNRHGMRPSETVQASRAPSPGAKQSLMLFSVMRRRMYKPPVTLTMVFVISPTQSTEASGHHTRQIHPLKELILRPHAKLYVPTSMVMPMAREFSMMLVLIEVVMYTLNSLPQTLP
jgi:hypothetical protein